MNVSLPRRRFLRIIVNGKNADDQALRQAVAQAERQGHRVELRVTREPGDGVLDVTLIHDAGLSQSGLVLSELRGVQAQENQYGLYRQVPSCRLELGEEIRPNVDGEPIFHSTFDFRVLHRRLKVILPPYTRLHWQ
jgi:diacylglycerol kinase family enzyme